MNKQKRLSLLLSLILAIVLAFSAFSAPSFKQDLIQATHAEEKVHNLYAFVNKQRASIVDGKWYLEVGISLDANEDGVINASDYGVTREVQNNFTNYCFDSATIYIRTRNYTAIAEQGDYTPVETSLVVNRRTTTHSFTVDVGSSDFQVGDFAREFYFEVYKVEVDGLGKGYNMVQPNLSPQFSSIALGISTEMQVTPLAQTKSGYSLSVMQEVSNIQQNKYISGAETEVLDTNIKSSPFVLDLASVRNNWFERIKYLSSINAVKLGVKLGGSFDQGSGWSWLYVDNGFVVIELHTGNLKGSGSRAYARWYIKFQSDQIEDAGLRNRYDGEFEDYTATTYLSAETGYTNKHGNNVIISTGNCIYYSNTIVINDLDALLGDQTVLSAGAYKHRTIEDKVWYGESFYIDYSPLNYRAKALSATVGDIRYDENGKRKIGLSVRFNEPLQFKKYADGTPASIPTINAYVNGNSINTLDFNYVAGEGTDTFYFEADASEIKTVISSIRISDTHYGGFNDVFDFAPNVEKQEAFSICLKDNSVAVNGWENISSEDLPCSFDLRIPNVAKGGSISSMIKTAHTATIRTEGISSSGKLLYGWVVDDTTVPTNLSTAMVLDQGFQTIASPSDLSGTRYLYVKAISELGRESEPIWVGPFHFDNDAPTLSVTCTGDTYKATSFKVVVNNKSEDIEFFDNFEKLKKSVQVIVSTDEGGENVVEEFSIPISDELVNQEKVELTLTLTAADLGLAIGGEKEYGDFYFSFIASDVLENKTQTNPVKYYFDIRDLFGVEFYKQDQDPSFEMDEFTQGGSLQGTLAEDYLTMDLSKMDSNPDNFFFRFKVEGVDVSDETIQIHLAEFVNLGTGESVMDKIEDLSSNSLATVRLKEKIPAGFYRIVFGDDRSEKQSLPAYIYVTNGKNANEGGKYQEETSFYKETISNAVFTNQVFQLSATIPFRYANESSVIYTENYGNSTKPATFSSIFEAMGYLVAYEYLDLYAYTITQSFANDLNSGLQRKALGVYQEAKEGQVWIRYKESEWIPNSTTADWVWYYYGDVGTSTVINTEALSVELQYAISCVASTICFYGKTVDLITEDHLDANGSPYVSPEQLHLKPEVFTHSKSGTQFARPVEYLGDQSMFITLDPDAPLSTNVVFNSNEFRTIYYKTESSPYQLLTNEGGKKISEFVGTTGKVTILELDENGVREFSLYIDNLAPTLSVSWVDAYGGIQRKDFVEGDNGQTISSTNFSINGLTDYDSLSFMAVYKYTGKGEGTLLNVYRKSYFDEGNSVNLTDGKYHIHVSDRSGNDYAFVLQISTESLVCTIKEVKNSYIQIDVNRSLEEIRYQVYLDGMLYTADYSQRRFTESGYYQFYIEDIYGNIFDEYYYLYEYEKDENGNYLLDDYGNKILALDENGNKIPVLDEEGYFEYNYYYFNRESPLVSWRYQSQSGDYLPYEEGSSVQMRVAQVGDNKYAVSTSAPLQFLMMEGCTYEILNGSPNPSASVISGWVTLRSLTPFSMKVYYEKHPDSYVIYNCSVDSSAPSISVYYQEKSYTFSEMEEIEQLFNNGVFVEGENSFIPNFIGFKEQSEHTVYLDDGEVARSRYFMVKVSDESGISEVEIYLNGELLTRQTSNFANIMLSRYGEYVIHATDNFGNLRTFTFTNDWHSFIDYMVDGELVDTTESVINNFDYENKQFNKVEYANERVEIKIPATSEVYYLITDSNGNSYYLAFTISNGEVCSLQYRVDVLDDGTTKIVDDVKRVQGTSIISALSDQTITNTLYPIAKIDEIGVEIYISRNQQNELILCVTSCDSEYKTYTVETRVVIEENISPYYLKTQISNIPSSVQFTYENGEQIQAEGNNLKINQAFKINSQISEEISTIKVSYSATGKYENYQTVYDGSYYDLLFDKEGAYHVQVINRYGITTDYYLIVSSKFLVTTLVYFADDTSATYSANYTMDAQNTVIYSNKAVEFIAYSEMVKASVNGEEIQVFTNSQGYTEIYIDTVGENTVRIWDEYGNIFEKKVEIRLQAVNGVDSILTGFNQNALKLDENYTNQKISVDKTEFNNNSIYYLSVTFGDNSLVIYDAISENKIIPSENAFINCIGNMGDGEYKVSLRDRYGNKAERWINYRETPTLQIIRTTLNGLQAEDYSIEKALSLGVWTNDGIKLSVLASEYILKVDGFENVTTINFENKTKNEYQVFYQDEYGFKYEFTVHLFRQDVQIIPEESVSVQTIGDTFVTSDVLSIDFTQNSECSYIYNGEEEKVYNPGDLLYKDGLYRFKVVDLAGNTATYTIKKDSIVEYRLESSSSGETMLNGGVTNGASVKFFANNSDSAYIKKVFLNGELIEYDDNTFTQSGKWELIVADDVGNESYFRFYIIRGKLSEFNYLTPYDYLITSVTWELMGSSVQASETIKDGGKGLLATENGNYEVKMTSSVTGDEQIFKFTIDKTPPQVTLEGCEENEKTINNVTIDGYELGDTIFVYKDGKLIKTIRVDSNHVDIPVISEGGKYEIVVQNEAGVSTSLKFERKYIPNVAGSVLIIVLSLAMVIALLVGLIWRNHSRTDG